MICGRGRRESEGEGEVIGGKVRGGLDGLTHVQPRHVAVVVVLRPSGARTLWLDAGLAGTKGTSCWRCHQKKSNKKLRDFQTLSENYWEKKDFYCSRLKALEKHHSVMSQKHLTTQSGVGSPYSYAQLQQRHSFSKRQQNSGLNTKVFLYFGCERT